MPSYQRHVFVCNNERPADNPKGSCARACGNEVREALKAELASRGLHKIIRANSAGCLGHCEHGAVMVVYPEQVWYGRVTAVDVKQIVDEHLLGGRPVTSLMLADQPHLSNEPLPQISQLEGQAVGARIPGGTP